MIRNRNTKYFDYRTIFPPAAVTIARARPRSPLIFSLWSKFMRRSSLLPDQLSIVDNNQFIYNTRSLREYNLLRAAGTDKYGETAAEKLARSLSLFFPSAREQISRSSTEKTFQIPVPCAP